MKLTKARINKLFLKIKDNQTRKRFKNKKVLTHSSTYRNKESKQMKNTTLKHFL